jgi:hypothetical protein
VRRRLLSYLGRHHWGLLATFIALSGTAYAAGMLPANSVGTRQLKNHAVTLRKISKGALTTLRTPPTTLQALRTNGYFAQSSQGTEPTGVSTLGQVTMPVPAGNYVATGGCTAHQGSDAQTSTLAFVIADSFLTTTRPGHTPSLPPVAGSPGVFSSEASVPNRGTATIVGHNIADIGSAPLSESGGFSLPSGGVITETCSGDPPAYFDQFYLTAVKVSSLKPTGSG